MLYAAFGGGDTGEMARAVALAASGGLTASAAAGIAKPSQSDCTDRAEEPAAATSALRAAEGETDAVAGRPRGTARVSLTRINGKRPIAEIL
jgi:hypothetical protein